MSGDDINLRKAAEMALARLEHTIAYSNEEMKKIDDTKHALRQALSQPEQKPVAWMWENGYITTDKNEADEEAIKLYRSPPLHHDWIVITEEEIDNEADQTENFDAFWDGVLWASKKLKEKNT